MVPRGPFDSCILFTLSPVTPALASLPHPRGAVACWGPFSAASGLPWDASTRGTDTQSGDAGGAASWRVPPWAALLSAVPRGGQVLPAYLPCPGRRLLFQRPLLCSATLLPPFSGCSRGLIKPPAPVALGGGRPRQNNPLAGRTHHNICLFLPGIQHHLLFLSRVCLSSIIYPPMHPPRHPPSIHPQTPPLSPHLPLCRPVPSLCLHSVCLCSPDSRPDPPGLGRGLLNEGWNQ